MKKYKTEGYAQQRQFLFSLESGDLPHMMVVMCCIESCDILHVSLYRHHSLPPSLTINAVCDLTVKECSQGQVPHIGKHHDITMR
jgi:hypothetical protein